MLILTQSPVIEPFIAVSVIIMAAGAVVGAFYIVVGKFTKLRQFQIRKFNSNLPPISRQGTKSA
jgi:hypothetical protein